MVWLQAEHANTSPIQSSTPSSPLCPTPSPSAVGIYLGRLSVAATTASTTTTNANDPAASPTRGGGGGRAGGDATSGGGSGASSPKARPKSGVPAVPDATAGVTKDIELDGLVAYTKESTADWMQDVSSDCEDEDGRVGSYHVDGKCLRPVPPFEFSAVDASPATRSVAAAPAAGVPSSTKRVGREKANRSATRRGDTSPVFIVRPLRVRGALLIRERGAATAPMAPAATAEGLDPAVGEDAAAGGGNSTGGVVEPPPLVEVSLDVEAVAVQLDVRQYAVLNEAVSALTMSHRRFKFRTVRPTTSVLDDPEAWWRYAIR